MTRGLRKWYVAPKFTHPGGVGLAALILEITILYYSRAAIDLLHSEVFTQKVTPGEIDPYFAIQLQRAERVSDALVSIRRHF